MITITKLGVILEKTDNAFESEGVLNPAVMQEGDDVHMFYRAFKKGNFSALGYCRFEGPTKIVERKDHPVMYPSTEEEKHGVEDARMTKIEGKYYLTYTAYDGHNALGAVATTSDFEQFNKLGVVVPKVTFEHYYRMLMGNNNLSDKYLSQYNFLIEHGMIDKVSNYLIWDKNLILFPEKINGKFALLHRLFPGIQLVCFNDFSELNNEFWMAYLYDLHKHIVMDPVFPYETSHIGGGCPPIKTDKGWLFIYHAVEVTPSSNVYHASAALLDLENPQKVIARLKQPLISPQESWEKNGYVNNVCFPTGTALFGKDLHIYYGAADSTIAVAKVNMDELMQELLANHRWEPAAAKN